MQDSINNNNVFTGTEPKEMIQNFMRKHGFIIVKNCFTEGQIEHFKKFFESPENKIKFIEAPPARYIPGASHIVDGFENAVAEPRLLNVLNKIINGKVAYTSHSDLHSGLSTGWHKDDGGGVYFEGQSDFYTNESCNVYRVGIYLRDCTNDGGLSVKVGSQYTPNLNVGKELYLPSGLGDAVIFDVRLTHKGWVKKRNIVSEILIKLLKKFKVNIKRDEIPFDKKSIFLAYGALNKFTEIYSIKNMEKQNEFFDEDVSVMPINLKNSLREKGIHYYFE
jgi:hypothetical protein